MNKIMYAILASISIISGMFLAANHNILGSSFLFIATGFNIGLLTSAIINEKF